MTKYKAKKDLEDSPINADRNVRIRFTSAAWDKMWQYTYSVKEEISGYGHVVMAKDPDGTDIFLVDDILIFKQTVSGADTEIDAASVAALMAELHRRGESAEHWRLWWHSHNNMAVFWSGTDETAMGPANNIGRDWLISVVVNFKRETKGRLDVYKPTHLTLDDVEVESEESELVIPQSITDEVAAKVTKRNGAQGVIHYPSYTTYYSDSNDDDDTPAYNLREQRIAQLRRVFENIAPDDLDAEDYMLCRDVYCEDVDKLSKKQIKRGRVLLKQYQLEF